MVKTHSSVKIPYTLEGDAFVLLVDNTGKVPVIEDGLPARWVLYRTGRQMDAEELDAHLKKFIQQGWDLQYRDRASLRWNRSTPSRLAYNSNAPSKAHATRQWRAGFKKNGFKGSKRPIA